jgi:tetratricopeptide (TPR) repeat protein
MGMSLNQILHRFIWNGLGIVAIGAPLAVGAVHWPVQMTLAAIAGALLLAYSLLAFRRGFRIRVDGYIILGLALIGGMLLQLMPLSDGLLESLSPHAFAGYAKARELGYDVVGRISVAPAATVHLICLVATALCLYVVVFNLSYREGNGNKILAVVGIGGALVATLAFVHFATGSKLILGFYSPAQGVPASQVFFSSFVNNNNAAGFLNLSLFILAGQWQKAQFGKVKGIYAVLVLVTAAASVVMLSRGGLLAMMMGGLFLAAITRWGGGNRGRSGSYAVTAAGIMLSILAVFLFFILFNQVLGQVEDTRLFPFGEAETKVLLWERARGAAEAYRSVGAGGGAFAAAFHPFNDLVSRSTISHAENELVQPLVEFGLYGGAAILLVPVVLAWRRFSFARSDGYYAGALAGLFALGIQQLTDFAIRIPGVLLPAIITMGALSGGWAKARSKDRTWSIRVSGLKIVPVAAAAYLLLIVGFSWVTRNQADVVHAALAGQMESAAVGSVELEKKLGDDSIAWNAHDPLVYTLLGRRQVLRGNLEQAGRVYDHSVELCPRCVAPRIGQIRLAEELGDYPTMLARLLEVAQMSPGHRYKVYRIALSRKLEPEMVVEAWKSDPDHLYEYVRFLFGGRHFGETEAIIRANIASAGFDVRMLNYLGMLYLQARDLDRADDVATYLMGMFPEKKHGFIIQARIFIRRSALDEALLMYEEALERTGKETDVQLSLEVMGLLARMRRWDRFEALASDLRLAIGDSDKAQSSYHLLKAIREEMRGEYFAALQELDQAESATPYNVLVPLRKAKLQLLLSRPDKAVAEYRKALKIDPRNSRAADGLKDLERNPQVESQL